MRRPIFTIAVAVVAAGLLSGTLFPGGASAAEPAKQAQSTRASPPKPAKGKGTQCVADTAVMRRNHMDMLKHKRDRTMHEGIRTKQFSLHECLDCHAVKGADAKPVTVKDPKHFCRTCHDYAAVKIDCFECHASRPDAQKVPGRAALRQPSSSDVAALAAYLKGVQQ